MKAVRFYGPKDIRVENIEVREVAAGEVKVEVEWCGICGSDIHEYLMGPLVIAETPITIGHEISGKVLETGEGVTHLKNGDKVVIEPLISCGGCTNCKRGFYNLCDTFGLIGFHQDGGFAEQVVVNAERVHKIPDDMSLEIGALVEPLAVVHHAVRQSQFKTGDSVAVFGAGPIGLLLTSMLKTSGASKIFVIEVSEARRKQAEKLGATRTIDPLNEDAVSIILEDTGGVDVAYEVAGVQATFDGALASIRARGEVMIIALWEKPLTYNPIGQLLKEKRINTTMCYNNDFPPVIQMLSNKMLNLEGIITKKIYIDDIKEEGFETYLRDNTNYKILVTPKKENIKF